MLPSRSILTWRQSSRITYSYLLSQICYVGYICWWGRKSQWGRCIQSQPDQQQSTSTGKKQWSSQWHSYVCWKGPLKLKENFRQKGHLTPNESSSGLFASSSGVGPAGNRNDAAQLRRPKDAFIYAEQYCYC